MCAFDVGFVSAYLSVDRDERDVKAGRTRPDGYPEVEVVGHLHDMLNAMSERTMPQ